MALAHAILGIEYTSAQWRFMPNPLPAWCTVYQQTQRWGQAASAACNRYQLGVVAQRQERYDDAREMYRAAGKAAVDMGDIDSQAAVQHQLTNLALATGDLAQALESNQEAIRLARQASDALIETSALYCRGLPELRSGHREACRQTSAQVHASFVALNSPEANKVATLLVELSAGSGEAPAGRFAATGAIDVTLGGALEVALSTDVIKGVASGIDFNALIDDMDHFFPDIDVVAGCEVEMVTEVEIAEL